MSDPSVIQELVTRMLFAVDALDWTGVRTAFADEVHVDYTSLLVPLPADELIERWHDLLPASPAHSTR